MRSAAGSTPRLLRRGYTSFTSCLPKFLPLSRPKEGFRRSRQAFGDRLAGAQLAGGHQGAQFGQRFWPDFHVLADDEAFDLQAVHQNQRGLVNGNGWPS